MTKYTPTSQPFQRCPKCRTAIPSLDPPFSLKDPSAIDCAAENERLRDLIRRCGEHAAECATYRAKPGPCNCWITDALKGT